MFSLFGQLVFAWIVADFLSGFFHWWEDRYARVEWPIIGRYIAYPNELHHKQPTAFLFGTYWNRNWATIVPCLAAAVVTLSCDGPPWLLMALVFLSQANEIHAYGHRGGRVPRWIGTLHMTGILQSPKHHNLHHAAPFAVHYCVLSEWLNPWLDRFRVWERFEWAFERIGIRPKAI